MKVTAKQLEHILASLNWVGHVEPGMHDIQWLAGELAATLSGKRNRCDNCGNLHEVIIEAQLGDVCERCVKGMFREAIEVREAQEE